MNFMAMARNTRAAMSRIPALISFCMLGAVAVSAQQPSEKACSVNIVAPRNEESVAVDIEVRGTAKIPSGDVSLGFCTPAGTRRLVATRQRRRKD